MPETPDLTPPPDASLTEQQRARIRAQLAAAVQAQPAPRRGPWLVPGLAAAAVTAIVGAGAYAAQHDSGGNDPGSQVPLQPAASTSAPVTPTLQSGPPKTQVSTLPPQTTSPTKPSTTTVSTLPPQTTSPTEPPATRVSPLAPKPKPSSAGPPVAVTPGSTFLPTGPVPATSCAQEIARAAEPSLRGAAVTAERDYGPGTIYLYETKTAWVVCDDLSATDGGAPTLLSFHDKARRYEPYAVTTAVSENLITNSDGKWVYDQFVAGGRDFDGVEAITYVFPDGHVEDAVVGRNGMWSMVYLATDGVFMDPNTNETGLDPIKVRVRYTDGGVHTYNLRWGLDTCAQLNHGC